MIRYIPMVALAILATAPLHAAEEDTHLWGVVIVSADVSKDVVITMEGAARLTDDASRLGQTILRPSIGYKLGKNTIATVGYAYAATDPVGPASSDEHRLSQQLTFRVAGNGSGLTVTGRTRFEQRWFEGRDDMGWRLRQQLRATAPLTGKTRAVVWSEAFLSLDDTSWGQRSGLDRWRNSVGLSVPVTKTVTIEPGYINQWVSSRGLDRVHHIANVSLSARF
ncbi:MAG: hypothetical protein RIQ75_837 [Pseudomonadota bacterium]|jgi:hypothetical protein